MVSGAVYVLAEVSHGVVVLWMDGGSQGQGAELKIIDYDLAKNLSGGTVCEESTFALYIACREHAMFAQRQDLRLKFCFER